MTSESISREGGDEKEVIQQNVEPKPVRNLQRHASSDAAGKALVKERYRTYRELIGDFEGSRIARIRNIDSKR